MADRTGKKASTPKPKDPLGIVLYDTFGRLLNEEAIPSGKLTLVKHTDRAIPLLFRYRGNGFRIEISIEDWRTERGFALRHHLKRAPHNWDEKTILNLKRNFGEDLELLEKPKSSMFHPGVFPCYPSGKTPGKGFPIV